MTSKKLNIATNDMIELLDRAVELKNSMEGVVVNYTTINLITDYIKNLQEAKEELSLALIGAIVEEKFRDFFNDDAEEEEDNEPESEKEFLYGTPDDEYYMLETDDDQQDNIDRGFYDEFTGSYRNHKFVVRLYDIGHRCGYTEVLGRLPRGCNLECDILVHGGVTYDAVADDWVSNDGCHWIGFDCGHSTDKKDVSAVREVFGFQKSRDLQHYGVSHSDLATVKDTEFCIKECCAMIDQLIDLYE